MNIKLFYFLTVLFCIKSLGSCLLEEAVGKFRYQKLNLVWEKASKRLSESKLKILYSDLKVQEKEETTLKRAIAEGLDKDGLKEAAVRKRLKGILTRFGLAEHFEENESPSKESLYGEFNEASDDHLNKALFKDKKLGKLWMKAEKSGFSEMELKALREEFIHHQEKVDEYYSILERKMSSSNPDQNSLDNNLDESQGKEAEDVIRNKHRDLKDGYDRLHKMSLSGPDAKEFAEPRVQELWVAAEKSNYSSAELESLHTELRHYENRIFKLQFLHGQSLALKEKGKEGAMYAEKDLNEKIKQTERRVSKLHTDLEERILQKKLEL